MQALISTFGLDAPLLMDSICGTIPHLVMSMFAPPLTRRFEAYWGHESPTPFIDRLLPRLEKDVTTFVTRHGRKAKERMRRYRTNGTLQDIEIAN